jgi:hypothetical protein
MKDLQEGIWMLTKPLTSLYRYTSGCMWGATLRDGINNMMSLQQTKGFEPRARVECSSIMLGYSWTELLSASQDPFQKARGVFDISLLTWNTSPKCPEVYAIPNQKALMVADILVSSFCCFGVSRELHGNLGTKSRLLQVLWYQRIWMMCATTLYSSHLCLIHRNKISVLQS